MPAKPSLDMDEVVALSNDLLDHMEAEDIAVSLGAASAALTLGRLLHDKKMTFSQGADFISAMMNFTEMFFAGGSIN